MKLRIVEISKTKTYNDNKEILTDIFYRIEKKVLWFWIRAGTVHEYGSNDTFFTYEEARKALQQFMPSTTKKTVVWPQNFTS